MAYGLPPTAYRLSHITARLAFLFFLSEICYFFKSIVGLPLFRSAGASLESLFDPNEPIPEPHLSEQSDQCVEASECLTYDISFYNTAA